MQEYAARKELLDAYAARRSDTVSSKIMVLNPEPVFVKDSAGFDVLQP
jgi:hypothetical protein